MNKLVIFLSRGEELFVITCGLGFLGFGKLKNAVPSFVLDKIKGNGVFKNYNPFSDHFNCFVTV